MGIELHGDRHPRGFRADRGMTYAQIERIMKQVRLLLSPRSRPYEPLPLMQVFETLHQHMVPTVAGRVRLNWGVVQLPRGVEGRSRFDDELGEIVIEVSPETYSGLEHGQGRAAITVYHEVTHSFVHADQLVRISQIPHLQMALARATGPQHRHFEDTEWQANAGAAALAMPAEGLAHLERRYGDLTPANVQHVYGVSATAALLRLECFRRRRTALL